MIPSRGQFLIGFSIQIAWCYSCALVSQPGTRLQLLITDLRRSHDCPQNSQGHWLQHIPVYRHWGAGGEYRGRGTNEELCSVFNTNHTWSTDQLWLVANTLHSSSLVPFPLYSPPVPQCLYTGMCCTQWPWQSWESLRSVMSRCHLMPGWDTSAQRITWDNSFLQTY